MTKLTKMVLNDPSIRFFAKNIIKQGLEKDIVDVCKDIQVALRVLEQERDQTFKCLNKEE